MREDEKSARNFSQPIGRKETYWDNSPPCPLINQAFSVHFLYPLCLCLLISRKKDATENCKPIVGSFSILAIFNHTIFGYTQNSAIVLLKR
jgi:hypothetical protein